MFERFTGQARQAVLLAQEEARLLRHRDIAVEHLLIGVARVAPPLLGERAEDLREAVLQRRPEELDEPPARLPFARTAYGALQLAEEEVVFRGHARGGPAHLVLGVLNAAAHAVGPFVGDVEELRARALERAEVEQDAVPGDLESALRAGHPVPVILGDGLPIGHLGTATTDARVLLALLAADGRIGRMLRERGVDEATVRALVGR